MSVSEAPEPDVAAPGKPGTADGSPQAGTESAGETTEEGGTLSAEPDGGHNGDGGGADPRDREIARLREQHESQASELDGLRQNMAQLNSDPAIVEFVRQRMQGQGPDPIEALAEEMFGKVDEQGAWKTAMTKFGRRIREETEASVLARIQPEIAKLDGSLAGSRFERSLSDLGVDAETARSEAFKAHMKEMKGDASFRTLLAKRPDAAARWAKAEWGDKSYSRAVGKAENDRLTRAKGARLNGSGQRASATSVPKFTVGKHDPNRISKTAAWVRENASRFAGGIEEALANVDAK